MGKGRTAEGNRLFRRPRSRYENYIKVKLKEIGRRWVGPDAMVEDKKICGLL
jgi:hypothetical protein